MLHKEFHACRMLSPPGGLLLDHHTTQWMPCVPKVGGQEDSDGNPVLCCCRTSGVALPLIPPYFVHCSCSAPCAALQAILSSKDEYLINVLYATLVAVKADADLLQYHGPGLGELPGLVQAC